MQTAIHLATTQIYMLIYVLTHVFISFIMFFFMSRTLQPRSFAKNPFLMSLPFVSFLILYVLFVENHPLPFFKLIFYGAPLIINFLFYKGDLWRHLGNFCYMFICLGMIELLICSIYFFIIAIFRIDVTFSPDSMIPCRPLNHLLLLSYMVVMMQIILLPFIIRLWKNVIQFVRLKIWIEFVMATILSVSGILFIFPECLGPSGWIFVFIGIFISILLFFRGIRQIRLLFHVLKKEREIMTEDQKKYEEIWERHLVLRKQNHDISGHLQTISYLLSEGKIDETQKYIQELLDIL